MNLSDKLRQRGLFVLKALLGLVLLVMVLRQIEWRDFAEHMGQISLPLMLLLLAGAVADRFLMGYKWNLLLRRCGVSIPTPRIVAIYFVSNFLGAFTPGNLGGDAYRVVALGPAGKNAEVLSTVVLERFMGLLALLCFVIAALPFSFALFATNAKVVAIVSVVAALTILLMIFLPLYPPLRDRVDAFCGRRSGKISQKIHQFFQAYATQNRGGRTLGLFFLLTLIETGFFFFLNFLAARVGGVEVSVGFIFMVMPIIHFVLRMPITLQGIGLQEGLFAYALGLAGFSLVQGVVVSLVWRLADIVGVYLPGCVLFLCNSTRRIKVATVSK